MTPRQKALAASSPALGVLLLTAAWNLWDKRDEIALWLWDRT